MCECNLLFKSQKMESEKECEIVCLIDIINQVWFQLCQNEWSRLLKQGVEDMNPKIWNDMVEVDLIISHFRNILIGLILEWIEKIN